MAESQKKSRLTIAAEIAGVLSCLMMVPVAWYFSQPNEKAHKEDSSSEKAPDKRELPLLALKPPAQENKNETQPPKKEPLPDSKPPAPPRLPTISEIESRLYSFTCPHCGEITQKTSEWIVNHKKLELTCGYEWEKSDFRRLRDSIRNELDHAKHRR